MAAPQGVYVYGIVRAGHQLPLGQDGVGPGPHHVRGVPAGCLTAVVSDSPEGLRARRRDLMAHQEMLLALASGGPVIPMRFGVVAPDEATLGRQLTADEPQHVATLERIGDRVEMNVKALPVENALEALLREDANLRKLRAEARRRPGYETNLRLGEAIATALTRRAAAAAARALEELGRLADEVAHGPEVEGCTLNASFLVPRSRSTLFRERAEAFAAGHRDRVELRLTGPLPCYSFVTPVTATAGA